MKVLVTTSGLGSRLGELTEFTNKSLVPVGDKPPLAHIIDAYPKDAEFVVTVGHHGDLVRQFLEIAYRYRKIEVVSVPSYSGPGTSLALSMLSASGCLQEPFIFNAGDTIWSDVESMELDTNWLGGFKGADSTAYASFDTAGKKITQIHPKGSAEPEFLYTGLAGILDFETFWAFLRSARAEAPESTELNDLSAVRKMVEAGIDFRLNTIGSWRDVGNVEGLRDARAALQPSLPTLEKRDEAIFYMNGQVLKFFSDPEVVAGRVARAAALAPRVPPITDYSKNWYTYTFVEGKVLGSNVSTRKFSKLLNWTQEKFWSENVSSVDTNQFTEACESFYFDKSKERLEHFLRRSSLKDDKIRINGDEVPSAVSLLDRLQSTGLLKGKIGTIHGDFILDNVLQTGDHFTAIDWRQSFGGLIDCGDVYYDLGKLNHSLTMNHSQLAAANFEVTFADEGVWIDVSRHHSLVECEKILEEFCLAHGYRWEQVQAVTAIIWLNMSPLHRHPMDNLLYFFGRRQLFRTLDTLTND